ncbi:MAG: conjugative transposon protein TraM [Bacteroidetes bacterium]|nr:conjugative transposon protein TraM [Fibrella sp.]
MPDLSNLQTKLKDPRFAAASLGAVVCLGLIVWYFVRIISPPAKADGLQASSLNSDMPRADSTGSPTKSKLELADAQQLANPDRGAAPGGGLQSDVPGTLSSSKSGRRGEASSYIHGNTVPDAIYQQPDTAAPEELRPPVRRKATRPTAPALADEYEEEEEPVNKSAKEDLEKQRRLLALLQEYKADKIKKQQEMAGRALKPESLDESPVSSLAGPAGTNTFYGLQADNRKQQMDHREDSASVTIKAVVFSDQTIISGGRVGLRLTEPVTLRGRMIPEGTRLYGVATFGGQRVNVLINSVQVEGRILPMRLTVYDMDGLAGIYVPNVLAVKQGRQSISDAAAGFNVTPPIYSTNAPSIAAASVAQAGIQGAQRFLQRKVATPKATLKNNYYVLLK